MAGPEIGETLVETALTFAPWLLEVPVLGRILRLVAPNGGNESHAIEQLLRQANKRKTDRKTRIERNNRYVLKASDAMQCVEDNLMSGAVWFALGRFFLNNVAGVAGSDAGEILIDKIFACIESKVLKQTGKRTKKKNVTYFARPAKGHGHGLQKPRS
jgi:hypothetical protein